MKFFTNKSIWAKIIIVLIFIILFEFVIAKPSLGSSDSVEFMGKLASPIVSLLVAVGDGAMEIVHSSIMGAQETLIPVDLGSDWWDIIGAVAGVLIAAAFVAAAFIPGVGTIGLVGAVLKGTVLGLVADKCIHLGKNALGLDRVSTASYIDKNLPEEMYFPVYTISPEEIFQGNILAFNVDFFNKSKEIYVKANDETSYKVSDYNDEELAEILKEHEGISYYFYKNGEEEITTSKQDTAEQLRKVISQWYVSIRNIALVCMMIVLLYIGIRMLLSTLASDKAKYKQMLQDWFMGLLILFLMHYIMAFSVTIVQKLTDVVNTSIDKNSFAVVVPDDEKHEISKVINENGKSETLMDENGNALTQESGKKLSDTELKNCAYIYYPTNLIGKLRMQTQLSNWGAQYLGYAVCFLVLVCFTVFFIFTYLKRVLYMAFLTLMAPLVAVTYPIDKINDGKAQGFDRWFKEYIFNLLIQPMHLLLYYILVTSAFNLASENLLYSIVALGFMIPAEKLLRSFFGFEKAHTPGLLAGPAGAALTMGAINKLGNLGRGSHGSSQGGNTGGGSSEEEKSRKPRMNGDVGVEDGIFGLEKGNGSAGGGPSVAEAQAFSTGEDPITRMNREALEEKIADGQVDKKDLNEEQRKLLGLSSNSRNSVSKPTQSNSQVKVNSNATQKPKRKRQIKRKLARKTKAMAYAAKAGLANTLRNAPRDVAKAGIKFAGATALGTAGLVAGITSGDPSQAFNNTIAAGVAGSSLGGNIEKDLESYYPSFAKSKKTQDVKQVYDQVYNGQEYEDLVKEKYMSDFKKNNKGQLKRNFKDEEQLKKMLEQGGAVDQFLENGVDNIDDIIAAQKMIDNKEVSDIKEAILVSKYAKRVGGDYDTSKAGEWRSTFSDEYQQLGYSKASSEKASRDVMKKVTKFSKTKKGNYR